MMCMWKEKASLPIHLLLVMNAVGYTVTPPITSIFLSSDSNSTVNTTTDLDNHMYDMTDMYISLIFKTMASGHTVTHVWIAYSICGVFAVLVGISFLVFQIIKLPYPGIQHEPQRSLKDMLKSWCGQNQNRRFYIYLLISGFLYFGINRHRVNCMQLFLFTIAVKTKNIHMSKHTAALFLTTFRICFTCGRLLAGILSHWIPLQVIVMCMIFSELVMHIVMALFALESTTLLWSLSCVTGFMLGPTYPSVISWYNRYVEMTGMLVAVADIGVGFGTTSSTWLSGFLFQYKGPEFVFYMLVAAGVAVCLVLVPMQIVFAVKGERFNRECEHMIGGNIQDENCSQGDGTGEVEHDDRQPLVT